MTDSVRTTKKDFACKEQLTWAAFVNNISDSVEIMRHHGLFPEAKETLAILLPDVNNIYQVLNKKDKTKQDAMDETIRKIFVIKGNKVLCAYTTRFLSKKQFYTDGTKRSMIIFQKILHE